MKLDNLSAIITGGGSGMGAATARVLTLRGVKVSLWDTNEAAVNAVAKEVKGTPVICDVTNELSVKQALARSRDAYGPPRILVNCAGILIGKRLVGKEGPADLEHFQKVLRVNLTGTYNTMRLVAASMATLPTVDADGSRGVIINTASIAAFEGQIGQVAYAASKGGIVAMTLPAARELGKFGIRVMAIAPGAVATPMIGAVPDELQKSLEDAIPFPSRFAKPEEFAKLVLTIIDNDMLNGECIRLDGASRLMSK